MILTIPRHIIGALLDTAFGKAEPLEYTGSTQPVDKPSAVGHTHQ